MESAAPVRAVGKAACSCYSSALLPVAAECRSRIAGLMPESMHSLSDALLLRYGPALYRLGAFVALGLLDDPAMLALAFC